MAAARNLADAVMRLGRAAWPRGLPSDTKKPSAVATDRAGLTHPIRLEATVSQYSPMIKHAALIRTGTACTEPIFAPVGQGQRRPPYWLIVSIVILYVIAKRWPR
jgi:hypothetical protein